MHCFDAQLAPNQIRQKVHSDTLRRICVFATGGICGSRSAFRCVRAMKRQRTILMLGWDRYRFDKKRARIRYAKLVFLHPVGSAGQLVHFGSFGA
jgi:hypothetical protein